jgi:hypothetical protein
VPVAAFRSFAPAPIRSRTAPVALKALLAERFPTAIATEHRVLALATGLDALDGILPNAGLPRGRVTVWHSALGGATAVLRSVAAHVIGRGERVAWIDGGRTIGPEWTTGPLIIRPADGDLARKAAEILLRCGGFGLVVLAGAELDSATMLRFSRMVHEGGGAFVAVSATTHTAMVRLSSRYLVGHHRAARNPFGEPALIERVALRIEARSPGWNAHTILHLPTLPHDLRLSLEPGVADRRGDLD